uniref:Uncharacterized protein LOC102801558 n=1 Tax=Saccoglossus kowalevskii TaxID=10224 RepID=A0ABM0MBJ1_SACKO|nr:PREDICTED: uncharacterized protein LOC102801558 [Saccoglossus kowalevskii]
MRDNLLKAIAAKQLDEKYRSYKLASNIAKTILTNFVRPRKCYEEYFERCENLIHTHLDPYGYVDEKSPKKEPIQSDEYEADLADATECVSLGKHVAVVHPSRATHETPLLQNKEIQTNQEMSNQLNDGSARMRNQATRGRTTSYEETGEPKKHHPCDPNIADLLVKNNDVAESLAGQEGMKQRIVLSINHHRSIDAEQQNQSDIREQQLIVNADVKGIECMAQGLSENVTGQPLHPSVELSKSKVNERQIFPSPAHSGNADDSEIPTPAAKVGPTLNRSEKQSNSHTAKLPIHTSTTPAMASGSLKRNPASPSNTNVKHHDFIKGCEDDNGE